MSWYELEPHYAAAPAPCTLYTLAPILARAGRLYRMSRTRRTEWNDTAKGFLEMEIGRQPEARS